MSGVTPPATVDLREALAADLEFILAAERRPGYEWLTGQWTLAEHELALRRSDTRYLVASPGGQAPAGFVIVQPLEDVHEGAKFKRVVVTEPGRGFGRAMLMAAFDWVFRNSDNPRVWLDVFTHNERARRVYRAVGMREDGLLRQAYRMPDGSRADRVIMSILRSEWRGP